MATTDRERVLQDKQLSHSKDFKEILERIRAAGPQINEERQIPDDLIEAMTEQGLFRLLVPSSVGGGETDFLEYLAMAKAVATADGSTAWCFNQNNILGTMASLMPEELAREIWSDSRAILCNGPPQHTTITAVDDGYSLTGRWNFSSGSRHATWAVAAGQVDFRASLTMLIPKAEVDFIDVWQVSGLRGTGSFSFEVKDLFIPENRSFVEAKVPRESGPLYLIPRSLFFAAGFGSVALGVARSGLDIAIEVALKKSPQEQALLRDQPLIQREIGQAEALWGSADAFLTEKARKLWSGALANHELTIEDRIELRLAGTHAIRKAAEVVDIAYSICGASSIFESNAIQRRFQDAHAITQQIQGRMEHYETAGQFFLGLEPQGRMF